MSEQPALGLPFRLAWLPLACAIAAAVPVRAQGVQALESSAASGDQPGIGQTTTSANSSASAKLASFAGTVYHYFQETDLHPALADTTYRVSNIYSLELYGRARHMTQLPFYGIGPDSQLSNQTDFTLTERV